jgi:hypothetical protein
MEDIEIKMSTQRGKHFISIRNGEQYSRIGLYYSYNANMTLHRMYYGSGTFKETIGRNNVQLYDYWWNEKSGIYSNIKKRTNNLSSTKEIHYNTSHQLQKFDLYSKNKGLHTFYHSNGQIGSKTQKNYNKDTGTTLQKREIWDKDRNFLGEERKEY